MGLLSPILRDAQNNVLIWWCPGCNSSHNIQHGEGRGPRWAWNGDVERPTFTPSVLVTYGGVDSGKDGAPPARCHSFVIEGQMQMLGDCTHALAGQTVPIPHWPRGGG